VQSMINCNIICGVSLPEPRGVCRIKLLNKWVQKTTSCRNVPLTMIHQELCKFVTIRLIRLVLKQCKHCMTEIISTKETNEHNIILQWKSTLNAVSFVRYSISQVVLLCNQRSKLMTKFVFKMIAFRFYTCAWLHETNMIKA